MNRRNGRLFSYLHHRYAIDMRREAAKNLPGILSVDDVTQDLLLLLHRACTRKQLDPTNEIHVRQTIKRRTVDIVRRELRALRFSGALADAEDLDALPSDADHRRRL